MAKQRIAFIGLGNMGLGMACKLAESGYDMAVYNRTRSKGEEAEKLGARLADSPADAAGDADVLMLSLADQNVVDSLLFGDDGALAAARPQGGLVVDMSTVPPDYARELAERASRGRLPSDRRLRLRRPDARPPGRAARDGRRRRGGPELRVGDPRHDRQGGDPPGRQRNGRHDEARPQHADGHPDARPRRGGRLRRAGRNPARQDPPDDRRDRLQLAGDELPLPDDRQDGSSRTRCSG